jgi:hypothetical protein
MRMSDDCRKEERQVRVLPVHRRARSLRQHLHPRRTAREPVGRCYRAYSNLGRDCGRYRGCPSVGRRTANNAGSRPADSLSCGAGPSSPNSIGATTTTSAARFPRSSGELAKQAEFLYRSQDPGEQRRLPETVLSNCTFDAGTLTPTYNKPFDLLVRGNETGCWRGRRDSNPRPQP